MAVAWTTIPAGDVDVDSPVTTALVTALRDNPEGIAQRATGAPKIFGNPYDYQEFTSGVGPWVKPSSAETGDFAIIQIVGGGGSGGSDVGSGSSNRGGGGGGGGGVIFKVLLSELDASIALTIGAGGAGVTGGSAGVAGGNSTFTDTIHNLVATGGGAGGQSSIGGAGGIVSDDSADFIYFTDEGKGGGTSPSVGLGARHNGGGGGGGVGADPGASETGGHGGHGGGSSTAALDGVIPGGGGGGADSDFGVASGDGGDGVIRVWCVKED